MLGIPCAGTSVFAPRHRVEWLANSWKQLTKNLDVLQSVRQQARHDLLLESRQHTAVRYRLEMTASDIESRSSPIVIGLVAAIRFLAQSHEYDVVDVALKALSLFAALGN